MADEPAPVEIIDPDSLPHDDDGFDPCEDGDNADDHTGLVGALAFGTTSRHVLATWLPAAFKKWGVKYALVAGWEDRGRPISAGYFDPDGLLNHHTGSTSSARNPAPSLRTLIEGRSDLRGPLSQISTDFNGLTYIIAAGRANHAGKARAAMGNPAGDGNAMYLGNEVQTNGTQPMPKAQYDAVVRVNAAILDHFGYKAATKAGLHATTSLSGKWDLGAGTGKAGVPYDVSKLRADINALLKAGPPRPATPPAVKPAPSSIALAPQEDAMLVKIANNPAVFVTNGQGCRWLPNPTALADFHAARKAAGLPVAKVQEVPTQARLVAAFGPINGTLPAGVK